MASAEQRPSGRWRGVYRDGNGNRRYVPGTFPREKAARDAATVAESDSRELGWRDPRAARRPWGEWCDEWWPTRGVEASTLQQDLGRLNKYVRPRWDAVKLCDVVRGDIRAWATDLRRTTYQRAVRRTPEQRKVGVRVAKEDVPLSASTVQRIIHLFSASLSAAVDKEILGSNPAYKLKLPPGQQSTDRYLTFAEYDAVLAELPTDFDRCIADTLSHTGQRWGEMAGGHFHRLNQVTGMLQVIETWDPAGGTIKAYTKPRKIRDVPVPRWLVDQWLDLSRGDVCGIRHAEGRCRSGLLLTSPSGGAMDGHNWGERVWGPAVQRAGIGHCRVHDLRHTYASWQLQAGVDLAEVGRLLGHVSAQTTQRYAHLAATPAPHVLAALPPRDAEGNRLKSPVTALAAVTRLPR